MKWMLSGIMLRDGKNSEGSSNQLLRLEEKIKTMMKGMRLCLKLTLNKDWKVNKVDLDKDGFSIGLLYTNSFGGLAVLS